MITFHLPYILYNGEQAYYFAACGGAQDHRYMLPHLDQQMAYFIVNGTKRSWVKLCEANDNETNAILKYESDKNRGIEPGYYPEAEDNEELRALRDSHCSAGA